MKSEHHVLLMADAPKLACAALEADRRLRKEAMDDDYVLLREALKTTRIKQAERAERSGAVAVSLVRKKDENPAKETGEEKEAQPLNIGALRAILQARPGFLRGLAGVGRQLAGRPGGLRSVPAAFGALAERYPWQTALGTAGLGAGTTMLGRGLLGGD